MAGVTKRRASLVLAVAVLACDASTGPEENPEPVITAISPDSLPAGSPARIVTISGHGFTSISQIRVDGVLRPTTFVSSTSLTTSLSASDLAVPQVRLLSVSTSPPGGGTSVDLPLRIIATLPYIQTLQPTSVTLGQPSITLTVIGGGFQAGAVVSWDGVDRPTAATSATRLTVVLDDADLAVAGQHAVRVHSLLAPFDTSATQQFTVFNPRPVIASVGPRFSTMGHSDFTLSIDGTEFVPGAVVRWNGSPRPTTYVSSNRLTAMIPATDVTSAGLASLQVSNPDPALAQSNVVTFPVDQPGRHSLPIEAGDLLWDASRGRLYVSVRATDSVYPNRVIALDPMTGDVLQSVFVGSDPRRLAMSDDGSVLYVALDSAAAIRTIDLATFTAGLRFPIGTRDDLILYAYDIEVMPGHPGTIAVTQQVHGYWTGEGAIAEVLIFDNGVRRKLSTWSGNVIEFTSADTLYGVGTGGSEARIGVIRLVVTDSGAVQDSSASDLLGVFGGEFEILDGSVFTAGGGVVDLPQMSGRGYLPLGGNIGVDPAAHRVFYMTDTTLTAVDAASLQIVGTQRIPGLPSIDQPWYYWPRPLVRWGADGFAYRAYGRLVIFRSNLALP